MQDRTAQPPQDGDGLGQGLLQDLAWQWRFRQSRKWPIPWRKPDEDETRRYGACPRIGRFGDFTHAIADFAGKRWIVRERMWSGWPDPPTYAVFVFDGDALWMARDFERWPAAWAVIEY